MNRYPLRLRLPEGEIEAYIEAPDGPLRLMDLAFQLLGLSTTVAELGARAVERQGERVSCRAGCAACCRQLVPLSAPEAALIHELVEGLPEPRGGHIKARFAAAVERLGEAGLLEPLSDGSDPLLHRSEEAYFRLGIPCPFLENGNCSIYEARPSRCREYLVITPAIHCDDPYRNAIGRLPVSVRLNEALTWLWAAMTRQPPRLIPLTLALTWAEQTGPTRLIAADAGAMIEYISRDIETIAGNIEREVLSSGKRLSDAGTGSTPDA
jgi:Fe-S-cluster containining protein